MMNRPPLLQRFKARHVATVLAVLCGLWGIVMAPGARAQVSAPDVCFFGGSTCNCPRAFANETARQVAEEHNLTRWFFGAVEPIPSGIGELGEHQRFLINYLFRGQDIGGVHPNNIGGILPAWMLMSQQLTAVMMQQMQIVGTFLDAKHSLETQQIFRELVARAHKTYRPSHGMCVIGTNTRSLAATGRHSVLNAAILAQRSLQRQTGSAHTNAAEGPPQDFEGRMQHFIARFCDYNDNNRIEGRSNAGLELLCAPGTASERWRTLQTDIDYGRTIDLPRTIDVSLGTDGSAPTLAEEAVLELSSNLYGYTVFNRLNDTDLRFIANHDEYQDMRHIIAKRGVVQNSFNHIVGMKSEGSVYALGAGETGSNDTARYMRHFLQELGVLDNNEVVNMLGNSPADSGGMIRPSYYAQMEVLAKRIYQDPSFFTDLYDSPVNVKRKSAALQAIGLMLERDMYDSQIRTEMLMSQLLELRVTRAQRDAESNNALMAPIQEGD